MPQVGMVHLENCNRCKQHKLHVKFDPLYQVYCEICLTEATASEDIHEALHAWNKMQKELAMQLELNLSTCEDLCHAA